MRVTLAATGLTLLAIDPFWSAAFSSITVLLGVILVPLWTNRANRRADAHVKHVAGQQSARLDAIEEVLAKHREWDLEVHAVAKLIDPTVPEPPPLTITDPDQEQP